MGKLDSLLKPLRRDRSKSPSPHRHEVLSAAASSAPTPAPAPAPAPAPPQSAVVPQRPVRVLDSEVNPALKLAIQQHFNDLPEADKDAFLEASKQVTEENLLSKVRTYDDAHLNSSSVRPRMKDVQKFLGILSRCMAGLCTAIQANPDPSSIVVGAVQVAVSLAIEFVNFFDRLTEMLNCFTDYLGALAEYAKLSNADLMLQTVASVYGDLLKFCSAARLVFVDNKGNKRKWLLMRIFLRVQWEPFEAVFGDIETKFKHHLDVLHHSSGAIQLNMQSIGMEEAEEERLRRAKKENVAEREAFLGWISDLDFEQTHEEIYSAKHPGTGSWLIESTPFKVWLDNPKSTLLWCYGSPGAGKSVLMSNVVEHITTKYGLRKDTGISFAYYNYQVPDLGHPSRIVSSLIKQLCRKMDTISPELLKFKQDSFHPNFAGTQELFLSVAASFSEVFLIIDALDECPEDKRHLIVGFFLKVVEAIPRAKIFVTSRKELDIAEAFENEKMPIIKIEASNVTKDIEIYVKAEVKRLRVGYNGRRLYLKSDALEAEIIRRLTEQAEGMFLWVNLQLENLRSVSEARKDRLIESALEDIPQGLDNTYKRILRQIDAQQPYMKALACKAFEMVLYAKKPLRTAELRDAVDMEENLKNEGRPDVANVDVIIKACANLLVEENNFVRPIHYSVQEFFTKSPSTAFLGSCLENIQVSTYVHQKLALACLSHLQLEILHQGPARHEERLEKRLDDHPFLWYAARFFDHHVEAVQDLSADLLEQLERLIRQDGLFLASVIQVRKIQNPSGFNHITVDFDPVSEPVGPNTILYSTSLYGKAQLNGMLSDNWVPKYALHHAAGSGYVPAVTRLIEIGCSVNERDKKGATPLHVSALNGYCTVANLLLEQGAEIDAQGGDYGSALQAASSRGHEAMVTLLLKQGADVNVKGGDLGSALQAASFYRHENIVYLLLKRGADVNERGGDRGTALKVASSNGTEAIVRLLLKHGADANIPDKYFDTALTEACTSGHEAIVMLLLEHGAKVDSLNGRNGNPIYAAACLGYQGIVKILLEHGADFNVLSEYSESALQVAIRRNYEGIVNLMLMRNAI